MMHGGNIVPFFDREELKSVVIESFGFVFIAFELTIMFGSCGYVGATFKKLFSLVAMSTVNG